MTGDAARFDEYQLVVLKKLWLISNEDWGKYHPLRRELGRFLVNNGYDRQKTRKILTQRPGGCYHLDVFLASHLKKFLNRKIALYNQKNIDLPVKTIREVTELYQKREVLVA